MDATPATDDVAPMGSAPGSIPFEELWAEHAPRAMRLAGLLCGHREQAEDLVADAFVRVLPRWRAGAVDEFWPYLRVALVNQHRTRNRRAVVADRWVRTRRVATAAAGPAARLADRSALADALAELSPTQRRVLVLRCFEGPVRGGHRRRSRLRRGHR